jgi:sugar phosphate permease
MWGVVLACFAAVKNNAGAIAIRFFLGVFESAVTPGFALFTSQWYTKKEQGARTGIWFSFNGFAQVCPLDNMLTISVEESNRCRSSAASSHTALLLAVVVVVQPSSPGRLFFSSLDF